MYIPTYIYTYVLYYVHTYVCALKIECTYISTLCYRTAIDSVSGVMINCSPSNFIVQCTATWNVRKFIKVMYLTT